MAAATITQIMQGIEGRLATISGLRVKEFKPDQINPPFAYVGLPVIENYHETFQHGNFKIHPTVTVLVSRAYDRVGQLALAAYADIDNTAGKSVHFAIEADRTLGGLAGVDCIVTGFRPQANAGEEVGLIGFYGGVFDLQVIAKGS